MIYEILIQDLYNLLMGAWNEVIKIRNISTIG